MDWNRLMFVGSPFTLFETEALSGDPLSFEAQPQNSYALNNKSVKLLQSEGNGGQHRCKN